MKLISNLFRWLKVLGNTAVGGTLNVTGVTTTGGVQPTGDNTVSNGAAGARWLSGFFGTSVGVHDGTRFRGVIQSSGNYKMVNAAGNDITGFDASGNITKSLTSVGLQYDQIKLINKSGANSVYGDVYVLSGAADYSFGPLMAAAGTYLAASNAGQLFVCVENGIADGSACLMAPLVSGNIVPINCDGAMVRGQFCNRSGTNPGQGVNSAAAAPGTTYGQVMAATGGAGIAQIRVGLVWA